MIDGSALEKVIYHAIWVEFHVRESFYIHCFLWVLNAPTLTAGSKEEYISFADKIVHAYYRKTQTSTVV